MNAGVFIAGLVAISFFIGAIRAFREGGDLAGPLMLLAAAGMWWVSIAVWETPEQLADKESRAAAQHAAEVTPHKVSEVDGCTVYTFKPQDRWLYFTKCVGAETTTQNIYSVQSGKTSTTHTMEIKTK